MYMIKWIQDVVTIIALVYPEWVISVPRLLGLGRIGHVSQLVEVEPAMKHERQN